MVILRKSTQSSAVTWQNIGKIAKNFAEPAVPQSKLVQITAEICIFLCTRKSVKSMHYCGISTALPPFPIPLGRLDLKIAQNQVEFI